MIEVKAQKQYTAVQAKILDDFKNKAQANGLEYFALLGDPKNKTGASIFGTQIDSTKDSAARHARLAHIEWEKEHGIDPLHDRNTD